MKKFIAFLMVFALVFSSACAEIRLSESAITTESRIAAGEYGAIDAYFSPFDNNIYFLAQSENRFSVVVLGEKGDYETLHTFAEGCAYVSIRTGEDGAIYLIKQQQDESMKSGIVCLLPDGEQYLETEFLFPGASCDFIPRRFEFSSDSSSGCILSYMNVAGEYVPVMSIFNILWGTLEGFDAFVTIRPGALTAEVVPMSSCFDAYGYVSDAALALAGGIASGEVLSPTDACISPSGDRLLVTVPYMDNTLLYVIDVYSLSLELVYPPEGFSGCVGWSEDDDTLVAISDTGEQTNILVGGFAANSWEQSWIDGWTGDSSWDAAPVDDWGNS